MNDFINGLKKETNFTETENGAIAYSSTLNACLDAFGSLAAMKDCDEDTIIRTFSKALAEDKALAMKLLFYVRDIRGGQGMRRVFRVILKYLAEHNPELVINNFDNILYFGRGDDYLCLLDTSCKEKISFEILRQIVKDKVAKEHGEPVSLLAKWLPSVNASSSETKRFAKILIKEWGWSEKPYRKNLSELRTYIDVVEKKMSAKEWTNINYEKVPAKASMRYSNAFYTHDETGYIKYIEDVANGNAKVNAASLFPVDIVHKCMHVDYHRSARKDIILWDSMWKALPNYLEGKEETGICVVDVSGSMCGTPMEVAVSLGMYCADKCRGPFANHFISFSARPEFVEIRGNNIVEKVRNICGADWGMNTNLEAVFDLMLDVAVKNHCKPEDMPKKLYIISDMQFDAAAQSGRYDYEMERYVKDNQPFMQAMKQKYIDAGYEMPIIVYWNVRASNCGMFQETFEGEQCAMVSGYSPVLFKAIIEGTTYEEEVNDKGEVIVKEKLNPMDVMLNTLNNERYDCVKY